MMGYPCSASTGAVAFTMSFVFCVNIDLILRDRVGSSVNSTLFVILNYIHISADSRARPAMKTSNECPMRQRPGRMVGFARASRELKIRAASARRTPWLLHVPLRKHAYSSVAHAAHKYPSRKNSYS